MLELESAWKSVRHANFLSNSRHLAPNSAKATLDFIMLIPSGILISVRFPKGKIKDVSVKVSSPPGIAFVLAVEAFGRRSSRRGGHSDGRCCAVLSMAVAWPNFFRLHELQPVSFEVCCSASSELWGYDPGVHLCISWPLHCMFFWILRIVVLLKCRKAWQQQLCFEINRKEPVWVLNSSFAHVSLAKSKGSTLLAGPTCWGLITPISVCVGHVPLYALLAIQTPCCM